MARSHVGRCIGVLIFGLGVGGCGASSDDAAPTPLGSAAAAPELDPLAAEAELPSGSDATDSPPAPSVEHVPADDQTPSSVSNGSMPCAAPAGISASPGSIEEVVSLMNALPKPTTVACLLESLERPLEIYATRSELSAQPAAGAHNPRTFIVLGSLSLSVVPAGASSDLVELGYRTSNARSIKAEIAFPLTRTLSATDLIRRIQTGRVSMCAGCHIDERRVTDGIFSGTEGGFESGVIPPLFVYEIDIESYRAEAAACDPSSELGRCSLLDALFGHGEVRASASWSGTDASTAADRQPPRQ